MTHTAKDLNWNQFILGLIALASALGVFEFVKYDAFVSTYMRVLGAISLALGNLVGYVFLGSVLWGAVRLIRGEEKAPAPKLFLFIAATAISVFHMASNM
ncbi:MAG TPA: hypothetical protein VMV75_10750 [Sulfuricella sp.]|nr:hypothetical protein [Sulfuricella sp.]